MIVRHDDVERFMDGIRARARRGVIDAMIWLATAPAERRAQWSSLRREQPSDDALAALRGWMRGHREECLEVGARTERRMRRA